MVFANNLPNCSSLSTGLNSAAAVVLEDFYKTFFKKELSEKRANLLMKLTVVVIGGICVGLVFVVEKLGTVLQLTMSINTISAGPSLGLISMGILLPWVNAKVKGKVLRAFLGYVGFLGSFRWRSFWVDVDVLVVAQSASCDRIGGFNVRGKTCFDRRMPLPFHAESFHDASFAIGKFREPHRHHAR